MSKSAQPRHKAMPGDTIRIISRHCSTDTRISPNDTFTVTSSGSNVVLTLEHYQPFRHSEYEIVKRGSGRTDNVIVRRSKYPKIIYATAVLVNGKIYQWKIGPTRPSTGLGITIRLPEGEVLTNIEQKVKEFVVHGPKEEWKVFREQALEWFRQWPLHPKHVGLAPYNDSKQ